MRRFYRAIHMYFGSSLTWPTCWRLAKTVSPYRLVERGGFIFIEPRRFS